MITDSQQYVVRPADHRIALAHLRGLSARAIGEHLQLPTEYVERRLPVVVDMPIVVPPTRPTLANRLLAVLRDADGHPVRIEDLLGVYPEGEEGSLGSIKSKLTGLRKRGYAVEAKALYEMLLEPRVASSSRKMAPIVAHLRQGPATVDDLAVAAGVEAGRVHGYIHMLRARGGEIVLHRTYVLSATEESQS